MGLEAGDGFISGLVVTNPVGATDPKSQGDDHLRLLKVALKGTFPNLNAAVTASPTELNYIDGVTGVEGTGKIVLALTATLPALSGVNLTALNASNLASGTVPDARFPSTLPALNGSALTNLNATNLATGSVADARLSANVALYNGTTAFTANQTISKASPFLTIAATTASDAVLAYSTNSVTRANVGAVGATNGFVTGSAIGDYAIQATAGGFLFSGDAGSTLHFKLSSAGLLTTPNASAAEVGYKGAPQNAQTTSYGIVLADAGKSVVMNGASLTVTIPANGTIPLPLGTVIVIANRHSSALTIAITSDTLVLAGAGTTGSRTLAANGMATILKTDSTVWLISGAGLS